MKTYLIVLGIVLSFLAGCQCSSAHTANGPDDLPKTISVWQKLDAAYVQHDYQYLEAQMPSDNGALWLYAKSLEQSLLGHFDAAVELSSKCAERNAPTQAMKLVHFICLLSLSRNFGYMYNMKDHYLYIARARHYINECIVSGQSYCGNAYVREFMKTSSFLDGNISLWPSTSVGAAKRWNAVELEKGVATMILNGIRVPVLIDTGASGIQITLSDFNKYGLASKMTFLSAGGVVRGYSRTYRVLGIYTAAKLEMGPLKITNAYISVIDSNGSEFPLQSVIGIDVLRSLKRFVYTGSRLADSAGIQNVQCSRLRIRVPTAGYAYGWGIFLPLQTSVGDGVYFFDTGYSSDLPRNAIQLFYSYATSLIGSKNVVSVSPSWITQSFTDSDGLKHLVHPKFIMVSFPTYGSTKPFMASILPRGYRDGNQSYYGDFGIIGRNTVEQVSLAVSLDFRNSTACVGSYVQGQPSVGFQVPD